MSIRGSIPNDAQKFLEEFTAALSGHAANPRVSGGWVLRVNVEEGKEKDFEIGASATATPIGITVGKGHARFAMALDSLKSAGVVAWFAVDDDPPEMSEKDLGTR